MQNFAKTTVDGNVSISCVKANDIFLTDCPSRTYSLAPESVCLEMKVPLESWSFQTKPGVFQTQTKIMAVVTLWVKYGFSMGSKTKPCFQIETNQMFFSIPLFLTVCSCLSQAGVSGWTKLRNDHPKNYQTN